MRRDPVQQLLHPRQRHRQNDDLAARGVLQIDLRQIVGTHHRVADANRHVMAQMARDQLTERTEADDGKARKFRLVKHGRTFRQGARS